MLATLKRERLMLLHEMRRREQVVVALFFEVEARKRRGLSYKKVRKRMSRWLDKYYELYRAYRETKRKIRAITRAQIFDLSPEVREKIYSAMPEQCRVSIRPAGSINNSGVDS